MRIPKNVPTSVVFDRNQRMVHALMFNSNFTTDPGLFSGKMGLVLFFANYYRFSKEDIYDSIADELMEQILTGVHKGSSIGFKSGLCGIGWGVEYLIQNGFMEGDSSEICEEIDKKIMEKDPRRITNLSLEEGMEGLLLYVLTHLSGAILNQTPLPFDPVYLNDLYSAVEGLNQKEVSQNLRELADHYIQFHNNGKTGFRTPELTSFIEATEIDDKKITTCPIGLQNGIAGILLQTIINQPEP